MSEEPSWGSEAGWRGHETRVRQNTGGGGVLLGGSRPMDGQGSDLGRAPIPGAGGGPGLAWTDIETFGPAGGGEEARFEGRSHLRSA